MTVSQSLRLYELTLEFIKDKDKAKEYVTKLEEVVDGKVGDKTDIFEKIVTKDIDNLRQELYKVFATKDDIAKLDVKLSETKVDLIKWVFAFFATLALLVAGLYLKK